MFDDDDNNMCMNKWAHTRARMKKSCKQNKERKKEYCGLYHACAKDGARARKRKRMEMKRKWNTDQNISQQNAKHIRIVLIIMWMCHKCKLHSLANVRIVPNVEQWNMWKNWCGLAWLWLPSSYSILNIRCSKMPRQCDKRKICKAQSKHQFYVSSFLLCSIHFIWFIRLYYFNGGCHLTTERDHPKCKKAQMISLKRFKCVWVCMKYSDANEIDKRKAHIMAPRYTKAIDSISISTTTDYIRNCFNRFL